MYHGRQGCSGIFTHQHDHQLPSVFDQLRTTNRPPKRTIINFLIHYRRPTDESGIPSYSIILSVTELTLRTFYSPWHSRLLRQSFQVGNNTAIRYIWSTSCRNLFYAAFNRHYIFVCHCYRLSHTFVSLCSEKKCFAGCFKTVGLFRLA